MDTTNPADTLRHAARRRLGPFALPIELWADGVTDVLSLLTGSLPGDDLDEWDPEYIRQTLPLVSRLLSAYFRPEVRGLANVPREGPALLVGNHSGGTLIADSFVLAASFYRHLGPERRFHQLAHDLAARMPGFAGLRRYGLVRATHDNAREAFERGAAVLVYPGGDWETFRPSWQSEDVDLAGRTGFIRLALDGGVPVVPVVAIGGQETAFFLTRGERLARRLRLDRLLRTRVVPIALAPPFGLSVLDLPPRLPLPAQITVQVLLAFDIREQFGSDPELGDVYEAIEARMQEALDDLAEERDLPLLGALGKPSGDGADARRRHREAEGATRGEREAGDGAPRARPRDRAEAAAADGSAAASEEAPETPAWLPPAPRRSGRPAPGADRGGEHTAPEPAAGEPAAPPSGPGEEPPPLEPDAVVAELADPGAAAGAGADVRVDEPWEGYASLRVREVVERLRTATAEELAAVRLYEQLHKGRRGVLTAVDRELARR